METSSFSSHSRKRRREMKMRNQKHKHSCDDEIKTVVVEAEEVNEWQVWEKIKMKFDPLSYELLVSLVSSKRYISICSFHRERDFKDTIRGVTVNDIDTNAWTWSLRCTCSSSSPFNENKNCNKLGSERKIRNILRSSKNSYSSLKDILDSSDTVILRTIRGDCFWEVMSHNLEQETKVLLKWWQESKRNTMKRSFAWGKNICWRRWLNFTCFFDLVLSLIKY